jgi:hypothetical protein
MALTAKSSRFVSDIGVPLPDLFADALMIHPWFHGSITSERGDELLVGYVACHTHACARIIDRCIASPKALILCAQAVVVLKTRSLSSSGDAVQFIAGSVRNSW